MWTNLKLMTNRETLEIPVLAQWQENEPTADIQAAVRPSPQLPPSACVASIDQRHLPVYFLIDASKSMDGAPRESLRSGFKEVIREASSDPYSRDVVLVGVIEFSRRALMVTPGLVPVTRFPAPAISPGFNEVTRLDLAFELLCDSIDRDVKRAVLGGTKGDLGPLVFVLLDGPPTDELGRRADYLWQAARERVVRPGAEQVKVASIMALACGSSVERATLEAISTGPIYQSAPEITFGSLYHSHCESQIESETLGR